MFNFEDWHVKRFGYKPLGSELKSGLYYDEVAQLVAAMHEYYVGDAIARNATLDEDLDGMYDEYLEKKDKL